MISERLLVNSHSSEITPSPWESWAGAGADRQGLRCGEVAHRGGEKEAPRESRELRRVMESLKDRNVLEKQCHEP